MADLSVCFKISLSGISIVGRYYNKGISKRKVLIDIYYLKFSARIFKILNCYRNGSSMKWKSLFLQKKNQFKCS